MSPSKPVPLHQNKRVKPLADADVARYAALVDQMVDGLFVADSAGRYVDVNRAGCEMLGYSREEILGMSIADVVAGEEIVRVTPEVERLSGGDVVRSEWHFRRKDGSLFIGEVVGRQLPDGRLQAILRDVSASRAVEDRLRQAEERYRVALAAAELGTWIYEVADATVRLDAQARNYLGVAKEIVQAAELWALLHANEAARIGESIAAVLDPEHSSGVWANDFRIVAADGTLRWVRVHAHIEFRGEGKNGRPARVIGTIEDITSRKRVQAWLARLSKAYETRSEINKCVARAANERDLLFGACRIAVEHAGFLLARVIPLECDALVGPPIQHGLSLETAPPSDVQWSCDALACRRLWSLLREQGHHCTSNFGDDPFLASQREACAQAGIGAVGLFPLLTGDHLAGVMAFYAADADCFDADMLRLLDEMAADISFGLGSLAEARRVHDNELRFSTIFRTSPDCILIVRMSDDRLMDANDGFLRSFGYGREEVVGRTIADIGLWVSESSRATMLAALEREGRIRDVEASWRHRSGEVRDCLVSGEIVVLGGARHLSCVVTDVTERRAVDRLLYAREQEFRALAENSPDIISRFDREGRRVYANRELARCFGVSLNDVIGKTPTQGMPGLQVARQIQEAVVKVIASAQETELDVSTHEGAGGKVVHRHVRIVPEFDTAGQVTSVLAIARDITRLKETKRRLKEIQEQLRDLDARREHAREDERKRMAREIHDILGQMLTALRLDIDMLRMDFGAEQPQLLARTARTLDLVDQTIAVVRNVATALRPPVLDMGIVSALEWLGKESVGCGTVEVSMQEGDIDLDEGQAIEVFRIVQESLTNVARHARARKVAVSLRHRDGGYELEVSDDGVGFDPEAVVMRSLGLVGMRERAASLGGELWIESCPGAGTRIRVRFPETRGGTNDKRNEGAS